MNCRRCGTEIQYNAGICPSCGESVTEVDLNSLGMKWYIFQAYVIMPLGALLNSFIGISLFPGVLSRFVPLIADAKPIPDELNSLISLLNSHKEVHMIFAFIVVSLSIYYAYVSFAMIEHKKSASKHIYISLVLSQVTGIIYSAVMIIITGNIGTDVVLELAKDTASSVIAVAFLLFVYKKYYDKRMHLFTK